MDNYNNSRQTPYDEPEKGPIPKKKNGCLGALLYLITIIAISALLAAAAVFCANDIFAFTKEDTPISITVSADTTVKDLSKQLDEQGVINYGMLFKLFVTITKKDTNVLAGDYPLSPAMDYGAIVRHLRTSDGDNTVTVTFPEGFTVAQIKEQLISHHVCKADELEAALTSYRFKYDFLQDIPMGENWLEGYLFPDTYQFYVDDNAVDVVNKMLSVFSTKYDEKISEGAQSQERSMRDILIIASMVEREAQKDDEFATIAGVIYNRLNNSAEFPYLQIDATLQYAIGHKEELTGADLELDSPYNTNKYKGLPPGPIANPGYTALYAASHPEKNSFYYYVAMPDGSHLFAGTLSQHNANIATAKQAFAAQNGN